jgi:hypothetical protein
VSGEFFRCQREKRFRIHAVAQPLQLLDIRGGTLIGICLNRELKRMEERTPADDRKILCVCYTRKANVGERLRTCRTRYSRLLASIDQFSPQHLDPLLRSDEY